MPISRAEVLHVATLARLALSEREIEVFSDQLDSILRHMDSLSALDLAGIPPTAQVIPLTNVFRDDVATSALPQAAVLANAPMQESGFFRVAPVFDEA